MKTVHAIYEKGVFRPTRKVDLPERCKVTFVPQVVQRKGNKANAKAKAMAMEKIFEILSHSYDTGIRDLAARHNEHQP